MSKNINRDDLRGRRFLSGREVEASGDYPLTNSTLEKLRHFGGGPAYVKLSPRKIVYARDALDAWLAERVRTSTAAA